ncbi:MAG TPA: glutathione S-transferase family protein [Allosphingosinicella sp.]
MTLTLYYHPFSSFCQKVLVALYENGTAFEPRVIDLRDPQSRAELAAVWPLAKFPVLRDEEAGVTVPESGLIIEYLAEHHPGPVPLVPSDGAAALQARIWDRFFDNYVDVPMQTAMLPLIFPDRPTDKGVEEARAALERAYKVLDAQLAGGGWAAGEAFTIADCAAAPALFYARLAVPFGEHSNLAAYFERLMARPSFRRAVDEARPFRAAIRIDWPQD